MDHQSSAPAIGIALGILREERADCSLSISTAMVVASMHHDTSGAVQAGMAALKCPLSYEAGSTREDPLHAPLMQELARDIPWTKHIKSKLMCAMSKTVMDGNNSPFVLPSGVVYGKTALDKASCAACDGRMTCCVTRKPFTLQECVPAYIM